jgi:hypothetical protein
MARALFFLAMIVAASAASVSSRYMAVFFDNWIDHDDRLLAVCVCVP